MIRVLSAIVMTAMLANFTLDSPSVYMKDLKPTDQDYTQIILELKLGLREEVDGQVRVGMNPLYLKARNHDLEYGTKYTYWDGRGYNMYTGD